MKIIYNKIFLGHDTGMHPENKKRLEMMGPLEETEIINGEPFLELVHDKKYIRRVKDVCRTGGSLDPDTVVSSESYAAAVSAVGATVMAAERGDFALVRPPGHHAHRDRSSGFCLFNNIAVAVQSLVKKSKKVLIIDFDGHTGDGTEKIFYDSDKVFYWSLHQYPAFPHWGTEDEIGDGAGRGYTMNVPLPPGSGDDIFLKAVERLLPIVRQFNPDVVAVSAGFDAHHSDLLLDLRLSTNAYYRIGKILRDNFKNIFATLEGGYNVDYLPRCLGNFVAGINGEQIGYEEKPTESSRNVIEEFDFRLANLERNLSAHWNIQGL